MPHAKVYLWSRAGSDERGSERRIHNSTCVLHLHSVVYVQNRYMIYVPGVSNSSSHARLHINFHAMLPHPPRGLSSFLLITENLFPHQFLVSLRCCSANRCWCKMHDFSNLLINQRTRVFFPGTDKVPNTTQDEHTSRNDDTVIHSRIIHGRYWRPHAPEYDENHIHASVRIVYSAENAGDFPWAPDQRCLGNVILSR